MRRVDELFISYFQAADGNIVAAIKAVEEDYQNIKLPADKELVELLAVRSKLEKLNMETLSDKNVYDAILCLENDLEREHHDAEIGCLDYRVIKALAACYELQDYLSGRMARSATAEEE